MAKMRNLNPDERALTLKNVGRAKANLDYLKYRIDYCSLMIESGLEQEYLQTKKAKVAELRKHKENYDVTLKTIKLCEEQLHHGVEIKEKPNDKEIEGEQECQE